MTYTHIYDELQIYPFNHLNSIGPVEHIQTQYIGKQATGKQAAEETSSILDTLLTGYTRQAFFCVDRE